LKERQNQQALQAVLVSMQLILPQRRVVSLLGCSGFICFLLQEKYFSVDINISTTIDDFALGVKIVRE
jgi:hypothetical protein